MNPIELMEGFSKRLKATEKELSSLERKAKRLSDKEADIRKRKSSLTQEVAKHEEAILALEQEDAELKREILEAMLSDDTTTESDLKQRRKEIATEIEQHHDEIRGLREALDNLENTEQASAEIAAKLDTLTFGYAFGFGSRLRDALVQNELRLKGRQSAARLALPEYDEDAYQVIRAELNPEQVERERREQQRLDEHHSRREQEQAKKDAAANKVYAGVGAFGGNRRTEPDSRDFSS
jgi:predicted nuclease with TOPRIM domain